MELRLFRNCTQKNLREKNKSFKMFDRSSREWDNRMKLEEKEN